MFSKTDPLLLSSNEINSQNKIFQSGLFPIVISFLLAFAGILYLARTANIDEGMYLLYAQQLVDYGGKPYDDVVLLKNPGIIIVHIIFYSLSRDPKAVLFLVRTFNWFLYAGSILGIYLLGRTLFSEKTGFFAALLFSLAPTVSKLLINNTMEPGLIFFQTWSLLFAARALSPVIESPNNNNRLFLLSGIFAALSFLFKETVAPVILFSLVFLIIRGFAEKNIETRWSPLLMYIAGGMLGSIPLMVFLLYYNCFWEFLDFKLGIVSLVSAKAIGTKPPSSAVGPTDADYGKTFAELFGSFAEAPLLWIAGFLGLIYIFSNTKRHKMISSQTYIVGACVSSVLGVLGSVFFNSANVERYVLPVIAILAVFSGNWLANEFESRDFRGFIWFISIWIAIAVFTFFLLADHADLGSPLRESLLFFQGSLLGAALIAKMSITRRIGSWEISRAHLSLGLWCIIIIILFAANAIFSAQAAISGIQSYQEYFEVANYVAERTAEDDYIFSDVPIVLYLSQRRQAFNLTVMIRMSWKNYVNFSDIPRQLESHSANYAILTDFFFSVFPEGVVEYFNNNFEAVRQWKAGPNDYLRGAVYLRVQ
ncbi:MAG: ArnT family glycosyltransferase [Candidatus Hodarchaeota archaeon]